jgi:hypothetical protein
METRRPLPTGRAKGRLKVYSFFLPGLSCYKSSYDRIVNNTIIIWPHALAGTPYRRVMHSPEGDRSLRLSSALGVRGMPSGKSHFVLSAYIRARVIATPENTEFSKIMTGPRQFFKTPSVSVNILLINCRENV